MFSNKKNINILTSLLVSHGVKRAIVCPGSRNAAIVHNLNECQDIECYPVTDERSAGFYALGMALADKKPVAVCVTSGTALLNLAPAVAEASYRHCGIIVISADRPEAWIGQLDGQTLPQPGAFGCFVSKNVTLPEPHNNEECWHCNRLVNEALLAVMAHSRKSVHINVPLSEPLFEFSTDSLPVERKITCFPSVINSEVFNLGVVSKLLNAKRPMVIIGQMSHYDGGKDKALAFISKRVVVVNEPLASGIMTPFDLILSRIDDDEKYMPDFVLYIGDTLVSKRLKKFLRNSKETEIWAVSEDGEIHDTFMRLSGLIEGNATEAVNLLAERIKYDIEESERSSNPDETYFDFVNTWKKQTDIIRKKIQEFEPAYSQMAAIRNFELSLNGMTNGFQVHYANSTSIRLANIYSEHYVWCNRGVNGIEGSLSTAAGFSVVSEDIVFCVIGDLSFFYDQNALWNTNISGNFRILLLNNCCGSIFYSLKGLEDSAACDRLVAARHQTTAQGICTQNCIRYVSARNEEELHAGLATLMTAYTERPVLLEVFTDAAEDKNIMKEFMKYIKQP